MYTDIQRAVAVGIDAFLLNFWYGPEDARWQSQLINAFTEADAFANQNGAGFYIVPSIDGNILSSELANPGGSTYAANTFADNLATLKNHPSWMKFNGAYVIASFEPEALGLTYLQTLFERLSSVYGMKVYFIPVFLNPSSSILSTYLPITNAASRWTMQPYAQGTFIDTTLTGWCSTNNLTYAHPVAHTDCRPDESYTIESGGFQNSGPYLADRD